MNAQRVNKLLSIVLLAVIMYASIVFVRQQIKLNSYKEEISYFNSQIEDLNSKQQELLATQENVNSNEYIEKVAREKLEMYLPNEIVYIDSNK